MKRKRPIPTPHKFTKGERVSFKGMNGTVGMVPFDIHAPYVVVDMDDGRMEVCFKRELDPPKEGE